MKMPEPNAGIIARRGDIIAALSGMVAAEGVIADNDELRAFECDGLSAYK
jgi:glycolate oxidase